MLWEGRGDENEPDLGMSPLLSFFWVDLTCQAGRPRRDKSGHKCLTKNKKIRLKKTLDKADHNSRMKA